jgi:cathepsin F
MPEGVMRDAADTTDARATTGAGTLVGSRWMKTGQVSWAMPEDCAACALLPELDDYSLAEYPDSWDWRDHGAVSSVKNQKYCGSSWAFATAGDLEGVRFLDEGVLESLSEQQLVACDADNRGCEGGYPFAAMQYIERIGGLVTDETMPYKGICAWDTCGQETVYYGPPVCNTSTLNDALRRPEPRVAHIGGWQVVAMGAEYEELLTVALLKNGPIAVGFNAHGMDYYQHGVMGCDSSSLCNAGEIDQHGPCDPSYLDNYVLLVGYGEQDGVDYWVVKNSWGTDWGESGFYRIVRGSNHCGIANFAVHSVVKQA